MGIELELTSLDKVVIFSGRDLNLDRKRPEGLKGEAATCAFEEIQVSYTKQKNELSYKYGQYLRDIESNIDKLSDPKIPTDVRNSVASKLDALAKARILNKEDNFSTIHKIFHKLGQVFKGHGFRTKGEWGVTLASKLREVDTKNYKPTLENAIYRGMSLGINETPPKDVIEGLKDETNSLSEAEFKAVLNTIIFKKKLDGFSISESHKFVFYKNLSEEKKQLFHQELLSRSDWVEQSLDILKGVSEKESSDFVSDAMVEKFMTNPSAIFEIYKKTEGNFPKSNRFIQAMVEKALKQYLDQGTPDAYVKIKQIGDSLSHQIPIGDIIYDPLLLTKDDRKKLVDNVHLHGFIDNPNNENHPHYNPLASGAVQDPND